MNSHYVTIAGYLIALAVGRTWWTIAIAMPLRVPPLSQAFTHLMRTRTGRLAVSSGGAGRAVLLRQATADNGSAPLQRRAIESAPFPLSSFSSAILGALSAGQTRVPPAVNTGARLAQAGIGALQTERASGYLSAISVMKVAESVPAGHPSPVRFIRIRIRGTS